MSAYTCWQGLLVVYQGIAALGDVLLGEPRGAIDKPCLYTAYVSFTHPLRNNPPASNKIGFEHTFQSRLVISWVDQTAAETQLLQLINAIPEAIDANPRLGGALVGGAAWCGEGITGFATIGGVRYRVVDFTITILEKRNP